MIMNSNVERTLEGLCETVLEHTRVDGKIKLTIPINRIEGVDWIHLAQDRNKCRILVNTVINFQVS
jgi:hypothetical protein